MSKYNVGDHVYYWIITDNLPIIGEGFIKDMYGGMYDVDIYDGLSEHNLAKDMVTTVKCCVNAYNVLIKELQKEQKKLKDFLKYIKDGGNR